MARKQNNLTIPQPQSDEQKIQVSNSLKIKYESLRDVKPLTNNQSLFWEAYDLQDYFIALHGVAGTGKTYIAIYKAIEEVLRKNSPFKKIILVRSAVQSREIGHLPGDAEEKMSMFEQPYIQICSALFGRRDAYQRLVEQNHIDFISTSFIRGCTWDNTIIIVDEFQNCNWEELSTVITRVGNDSKIIFCGDFRQTDLKKTTISLD